MKEIYFEDGEVQENIGTMLPQVELDGVVAKEDVDNDIINHDTDTEVPRQARKLIAKIATLKAKIAKANELGYEKGTIIDLKSELYSSMTELKTMSKSLNKSQRAEINSLLKEADKKVTKEDIRNEKNVNESTKTTILGDYTPIYEYAYKLYKHNPRYNFDEVLFESSLISGPNADVVYSDTELRLEKAVSEAAKYNSLFEESSFKYKHTGDRRMQNKMEGARNLKMRAEVDIAYMLERCIEEKAEMEAEISPIVSILNEKGYKVKYASPGHTNLRKKEDQEPDGVYKNHLYSDARIMFDKDYKFVSTPKYWHWRVVDGCSYLDISPLKYDEKDGTPKEAFRKWKTNYMSSLEKWVDELPKEGEKPKDTVNESLNEEIEGIMEYMEF